MTPANQRLSDERRAELGKPAAEMTAEEVAVWLMKAASTIYLATDGPVADDISPKLKRAAELLSLRAAEQQEPVSDFERQIHEAIISRLVSLTVGSCSCSTMTPELKRHTESCRYRIAAEALELVRPLFTHPRRRLQ